MPIRCDSRFVFASAWCQGRCIDPCHYPAKLGSFKGDGPWGSSKSSRVPPPLAHAWLTAGRRAPAGGPQLTGARARLGRQVLRELSGGAAPAKVIATGHSLGGGLASLCGVWAALQWPGADVRVVTLGSPMVGNQAWVDVRARPGRPARPAPARAAQGRPAVAAALPCWRARPLRHGVCSARPGGACPARHAYSLAGRPPQGTRVCTGCDSGPLPPGSCATLYDGAVDARGHVRAAGVPDGGGAELPHGRPLGRRAQPAALRGLRPAALPAVDPGARCSRTFLAELSGRVAPGVLAVARA